MTLETLNSKLDYIIELLKGTPLAAKVLPCPYTLYSWLEEWYNIYKLPKLKPTSLRQIRLCIDKHIKQHLKDKPLNEITAIEVQKAIAKISGTRTQKYTYDTLGAALKQAFKLKIISENVMEMTDGIKHKRTQGKALIPEQQEQFLLAIKDNRLETLYKFYLLTGCRKSEPLYIKWTDIDTKTERIYISGTKTENAKRFVPIFPQTAELLKRISKESPFVFPYTLEMIKSNFKRLQSKHNLAFRVHDLRHTFATRCMESGISINTVRKWLGHANASTTANIYTHVQTAFELKEVEKFNPKI